MPIIVGDRPIFRIKKGDAEIREVRKGNELTWGLYEVTYINRGPKQVNIGYISTTNVPTYVWGYPNQTSNDNYIYDPDFPTTGVHEKNFKLHTPADATAAEAKSALGNNNGYKTHTEGWFEDNACFNYIPAITKDFHKDLTLYCKWRQRKYCFNGTYKYNSIETQTMGRWVWVED